MNTDYLKYDAASIGSYLRRRLLESETYLDQIYPGSDAKLLIDLFSWTFECLQYILNSNAANVLFKDAQLYDNMNRMVKLLSYNPKSYITSTAEFVIEGIFPENITTNITIPKYTKITTSKIDSDGNPIVYSFNKDYTFSVRNGTITYTKNNPILVNGEYNKYTFDLASTGSKYEIFTMENIGPLDDPKSYVDNDCIDVYIEKVNDNGKAEFSKVKIVNSLIMEAGYADLACEKRLNENKNFEFKFGDGIHGKVLDKGTKVHVIYLKSNGPDGMIESNTISSSNLELNVKGFIQNSEFIDMLFGGYESFRINYGYLFTNGYKIIFSTSAITLTNINNSSNVIPYEDVEQIREYAPDMFRIGNRLVTASDFRTYILNYFPNRVKDIYVCNNNEYCTNFYKWLDDYNELTPNIRLNNYEYADACDFNNIYIWMQPNKEKILSSDKKVIINECNKIKSLTTSLIPCDGIRVYFTPFIKDSSFNEDSINSLLLSKSYLPDVKILIKKSKTYISDETIKTNIVSIIQNYFEENSRFGCAINLSEVYQKIINLGYIESIKTVSTLNGGNATYAQYVDGLSFACFTSDIINFKDFEIFSQIHQLKPFQYASLLLNETKLISLLKITNDNSFTVNNDEI